MQDKKNIKLTGTPDPPGFLDFLIDPAKGLFSPLTTVLHNVFANLTNAETVIGYVGPVEDGKEAIKAAVKPPPSMGAPNELLDGLAVCDSYRDKGELEFRNISDPYLIATMIPFINVASWYGLQLSSPPVRAAVESAYRWYFARYEHWASHIMRRFMYWKYKPLLPEPYRLADFYSKGIIDYRDYYDAMNQNGLDNKWAAAWFAAELMYPSVDQCLQLLRRGVIDYMTFVTYLRRNKYDTTAIAHLATLKDVIPPLSDLIRFAVREAFGTHKPEEQYAEYEKWAQMQGLSKYFAGCYWWAHWDRISIGHMFDNYYRGYWSKEKLADMLRIVDIHPDDRDAIIQVAYQPPSMRELGYGYDAGVYSKADIEKFRRWGGLSPEDAKVAAEAMVLYRTEAEREAVRRELMYLFALGKLSEAEFREHLKRLKTNPEAIELWVERSRYHKLRMQREVAVTEPRAITRADAMWLFEHGLRDEAWFRQCLADLGYARDSIDAYVDMVKKRIEESKPKPREVKPRELTISQVSRLYEAGKLDKGSVALRLVAMGYSAEDAGKIAQTIFEEVERKALPKAIGRADAGRYFWFGFYDVRALTNYFVKQGYSDDDAGKLAVITAAEEIIPQLSALYRNGWIKADDIVAELMKVGLSRDFANVVAATIVKAEQPSRLAPERDLTKGEIIKGVKANVISIPQAVELLMSIGYDEWEAHYILEINKVVAHSDPEGYWEMRKVAEAYKKARGEKAIEIPDELIAYEKQLKELKGELEKAKREKRSEEEISEIALKINSVEQAMRTIIGKLKLR